MDERKLEKKTSRLGFILANSVFITGTIADCLATKIGLENNLDGEANPLTRVLIDNMGIDSGLIAHSLIVGVPIIYLTKKLNEITNSNIGSYGLATVGVLSYGAAYAWEHFNHISDYLF